MNPPEPNNDPDEVDDREGWPTLTFWYGLSYSELSSMPGWGRALYTLKLPALIANYQLQLVNAICVPHMKPEDAEKYIQDLQSVLPERPVKLTPFQYALQARQAGIGIERVPRSEASA